MFDAMLSTLTRSAKIEPVSISVEINWFLSAEPVSSKMEFKMEFCAAVKPPPAASMAVVSE